MMLLYMLTVCQYGKLSTPPKTDLEEQRITHQNARVLCTINILHVVLVKDARTIEAAIRARELVVHEPLERVGVQSDTVAPHPADWDVLVRHHKAFAEHKHAKQTSAKGHSDDVVRLSSSDH